MSTPKAILIDTTRCTGCEQCIAACKKENKLGPDLPRRWKTRIDALSSTRYSTFEHRPGGRNVRVQCRHCLEPACVSACLVGAMQKTALGPVIYDSDLCMGCRYCMNACPYGIPRYDWEAKVPYVRKCTMCFPRLERGQQPACVEACPHKAMEFGDREDLLKKAHQRIAAAQKKYVQRVYGEHEIGGTSVIYVSDIDLSFLAFKPDMGDQPLPEKTWAALSKVPPMVFGVGGVMTGLYWFIGRRMRLAEEARAAAEQAVAPEDEAPGPDADSAERSGTDEGGSE
jgi:formate dehydrogenase iron-sulfur subunit